MRKLAPMLCAAALCLGLAVPAGAYYASNENGNNEPGGPITSVNVTAEPVAEPTLPSLGGLTPDGNLALIDDILGGVYYSSEEVGDSQMQFVTVESKNGNTFYLVIDHATGDVYFLNLVDEADLLALLEDEVKRPSDKKSADTAGGDGQMSVMDISASEIAEEIRNVSVETMTPIEALNFVYSLKKKVEQ